MKVSINYEHGLNLVVGTAISHAVSNKIPITLQFGCATFNVPDFPAFLKCMWAGFCECSKKSLGNQMRRTYNVSVSMDDLYLFGVWVRYDEVIGGIRYGSVR